MVAHAPERFQGRVLNWMASTFSHKIIADKTERNYRFLEEALELVQSTGFSREQAHWLVDYVYDREQGEPKQEVGGVMVCLAVLCTVHGIDMEKAAEDELERVWQNIEKIRAKQAAKPRHGD